MSELHVDPLQPSSVDTLVVEPVIENVDAPGKIPVNLGLDVPKFDETVGVENSDVSGNFGKNVPNPSITVDPTIGASTKANTVVAKESLKKTDPETHVEANVVTPDDENSVMPDVATSLAPGNVVDYSESDNSAKSNSVNEEPSTEENVNEDPDVVIMNETTVSDKSLPTNPEASVARRTRSRAGKSVETTNTPVQTPKPTRSTRDTGKKPLYGPPKPVSKVVLSTEEKQKVKKRKAPPTSDSEFELETDVAASGNTSRKSVGRKKVPLSVPYAPLDNVLGGNSFTIGGWLLK
ncbi:unnamed protein product [Trifolium pratense]|uniref:Uncharacterized protein n=1 Tax=Trifolium pratense TaxID=57577 RepID=A0ACB0IYE3_TRIPR|nr:unnamed protein product [Trifolium pratense]